MTPDPQFRRDTPLARALKTRIRREGPLDVRAYMDACLYHPQHGVYRAKPAIGRAGDFVTAPEISQIFGELIGLWCAVVWQQMGSPTAVDLIEIGPGRGTLMRDALRVTRGVPGFHAALRVILVDSSEALTAVQRTTLADVIVPIEWHASLEGLGRDAATPALLVANELLDCQPRDQFLRLGDGWVLRRIGLDTAGELAFDDTAPPVSMPELDALHGSAQDGDIAEWGAYDSLRQALTLRSTFAALMIDYGHSQPGLGDTLQAVRRHRYEHPLTSPGEADVTMHVDFADVTRAATRIAGVQIGGPIPQAEFLGNLGALERASRLMAANPHRAAALEADVARLLSPSGMGTRFQAIAFRSAHLPSVPGFPA